MHFVILKVKDNSALKISEQLNCLGLAFRNCIAAGLILVDPFI